MWYRDIKLENIFIGADGRVKLGDFGLTMSMKQEVAISPVGTVEYMAPEVRNTRLFSESQKCHLLAKSAKCTVLVEPSGASQPLRC